VIFIYDNPGIFSAVLQIDDGEEQYQTSVDIEVLDVSSPLADFSFTQPELTQLELYFTDESTPGTNPIISWQWDFDADGYVDSDLQNPTYIFPVNGSHAVNLTISDGVFESSITLEVSVLGKSVAVELFTGTWCTYCPFAEDALHNLKELYGDRLTYIEYHIGDPLDNGFGSLLYYYPNSGTLPITIINGNEVIITGAGDEIQDEIEGYLQNVLEDAPLAFLTEASAGISGTELTGTVNVDIDNSVSLTDLKLVLILMEDTNVEYHNYNGDHLHNITLKREVLDITEQSSTMNFTIPDLDQLAGGYDSLPQDITLVIWIQTLEEDYDQGTCTTHNVIEIIPAMN